MMNNSELQNLVNLFKSKKLSKARALNEKLIKDYPKNVFFIVGDDGVEPPTSTMST